LKKKDKQSKRKAEEKVEQVEKKVKAEGAASESAK
jgi:hypothetical protein